MSWLRIDDKFEDHSKVEPLSDAAHRLWMRAACWCQKRENAHTRGFVPRAMLRTIAKNTASQRRLERLAQELVDARAGGTKKFWLWEPVDGGWRFHNWEKYQETTIGNSEPRRDPWSHVWYSFVYERDGQRCRYCGATTGLSIDHVIPRCSGGSDEPGNLVVACNSCNSSKGGRTPEQAGMVLQ